MKPAWLLIALCLAACTLPSSTPASTERLALASDTTAPLATDTVMVTAAATAQPSAPQTYHPAQYTLEAQYDLNQHYLQVDEHIRYTNNSAGELGELVLVVEAQRSNAGFRLLEFSSDHQIDEFVLADGRLQVPLASPLSPGEAIDLSLSYEVYLPEGAGLLAWSARQVNFVDWYPFVAPYLADQGWITHEPAVVGEHGVFEQADFKVHIQITNAPALVRIAAPASGTLSDDGWDFELQSARRFAWSASNQYQFLEREADGVELAVYFYEEHRDAAEAALEVAGQAMQAYSELFGRYPYQQLSVVEALFPDGMESDGLFFLDQHYFRTFSYDRRNYLTALTAHEVAHNWWFGQVGSDQATEPWLDEALAIYSELLYYERFYPELVDWWWEFRIERFAPTGDIDSSIYDHAGFSPYVQAVYMRGALFMRDLRTAMGDEAFFALLREYAEQGAGRITTGEDFFELVGIYAEMNLQALRSEYFGND